MRLFAAAWASTSGKILDATSGNCRDIAGKKHPTSGKSRDIAGKKRVTSGKSRDTAEKKVIAAAWASTSGRSVPHSVPHSVHPMLNINASSIMEVGWLNPGLGIPVGNTQRPAIAETLLGRNTQHPAIAETLLGRNTQHPAIAETLLGRNTQHPAKAETLLGNRSRNVRQKQRHCREEGYCRRLGFDQRQNT